MNIVVDAWIERIRRDLAPFVDPSTTLEVAPTGNVVDVVWTQRRKLQSAQFIVRDSEGVFVKYNNRELSYRAFFASEDFADISGIAQTSIDLLSAKIFVDTRASSSDAEVHSGMAAVDLVTQLSAQREESDTLTTFVMVTGEAGSGKTSVLKELVCRQARKYLDGSSDFVYLYVNAQGRALARFNEAVATELNELRVTLPHHAVAPLVKMGLLIPVIDGFDELIGVGGYDDAFSSIAAFVAALEGKGAIVASARSTYYEQEFLSRASRNAASSTGAWKLLSVSVEGWGEEERKRYVEAKVGDRASERSVEVLAKLNKIFTGDNEEIGSKPLFVARTTDLLLEGLLTEDGSDKSLIDRLIGAFILREQSEKLLRRDGGSILTREQIFSVCSDLAEEMWNLGTRELDRSTVREVADLALSSLGLAVGDQAIVLERVPNMAFLQPGESAGTVSFEHELFFDYFVAKKISDAIYEHSPALLLLMSRSAVPDALAESVAGSLREGTEIAQVLQTLSSVAQKYSPRQQLVRENSGKLAGKLIVAAHEVLSAEIVGLVFPGSSFHGAHLSCCHFTDCEFRRCDFTAATFVDCSGSMVSFESPLIDAEAKLEISGLNLSSFSGLRFIGPEGVRVVYEPREMTQLLTDAGVPELALDAHPQARLVDAEVVQLLERLARAYSKCNPICIQDDYLEPVFKHPKWQAILRIAVETEVLKTEVRAANGPRRDFVRRLVRTEDLLAGVWRGAEVPKQIDAFWRRLESEFPIE